MKRILIAAVFAVSAASIQAADVGVSISVGQPGFYGRIELGDYPPPQVVYRSPSVIQRVAPGRAPIYLHVRPGQERNWARHCREYNACGERVYFVQNSWYDREYAPRYRERHGERRDDRRGEDRARSDNGRGQGRDRNRNPNRER